jgi:hypothetical protein
MPVEITDLLPDSGLHLIPAVLLVAYIEVSPQRPGMTMENLNVMMEGKVTVQMKGHASESSADCKTCNPVLYSDSVQPRCHVQQLTINEQALLTTLPA